MPYQGGASYLRTNLRSTKGNHIRSMVEQGMDLPRRILRVSPNVCACQASSQPAKEYQASSRSSPVDYERKLLDSTFLVKGQVCILQNRSRKSSSSTISSMNSTVATVPPLSISGAAHGISSTTSAGGRLDLSLTDLLSLPTVSGIRADWTPGC